MSEFYKEVLNKKGNRTVRNSIEILAHHYVSELKDIILKYSRRNESKCFINVGEYYCKVCNMKQNVKLFSSLIKTHPDLRGFKILVGYNDMFTNDCCICVSW